MSKPEETDVQLAAIVAGLDKYFRSGEAGRTFDLAGPASLSVKLRNGDYKTKAINGGDRFRPAGAYLGKKGKIIVLFKCEKPTDYSYVELRSDQWHLLLNFESYMDNLNVTGIPGTVPAPVRAILEAGEKAEEAARLANPIFASW